MRIGVLGCADVAWRRMLPAIVGHPQVELAVISSRNREKARRFADRFGGRPVTGYAEALDDPRIDAVYLPLPPALTVDWADRALRAGKHVLAEKPLLAAPDRVAELVRLARSRELVLFENYMFRCHRQHEVARAWLAAGRIGALRSLTAEFSFPGKRHSDIRYDAALGGGSLNAVGVYPLRTASTYLGGELAVAGAHLDRDPVTGVDLGGAALLVDPNGAVAQLSFGMDRAYRSRYELGGTEGRIVVSWAYTPPPDHAPVLQVEHADGVEEHTLPADDQFHNVVDAFLARVRGGAAGPLEGSALVDQAGLLDRVRRHADCRTRR